MHKNWNYGPNTFKEFRITPSYRVDAIDFSNKLIYELKPNNPNAEKRGYIDNSFKSFNHATPPLRWSN